MKRQKQQQQQQLLLLITVALLALNLMACNKQFDLEDRMEPTTIYMPQPYAVQSPANPYESAGELHNQVLDAVRKTIQSNTDRSQAQIEKTVSDYFKTLQHRDVQSILKRGHQLFERYRNDEFRTFIPELSITEIAKRYLERLKEDTERVDSYEAYVRYAGAVDDLEKEINRDQQLDDRGRELLLATAAVARHSGLYWARQLELDNTRETGKANLLHRLLKWHACTTTDMFAATLGMITFRKDFDAFSAYESAQMGWYVDAFFP